MYKSKVKIQIRFGDIDCLGHVNTANIQHYFDLGKCDFFKEVLGIIVVSGEHGFVQANVNTDFKSPIFIDDEVYVETSLSKLGNKSFAFFQQIICEKTGTIKAESSITIVCFNAKTQKAEEMNEQWRIKFRNTL